MDGMLSQDEINALLNGMSTDESDSSTSAQEEHLTMEEKDAIGEIANISMGTAATTLFSLVNKKVTITTPVVTYANWEEVVSNYDRPCVFIQISYKEGLDGKNILILKEKDVKVITDLMMGGDGTNNDGELSELHVSAICEAMNQMMGSSATSLSSMLNKMIDISPPTATVVDMNETINEEEIASFLTGEFVRVSFRMEIEGLVDSNIMQLYPFEFARELYDSFVNNTTGKKAEPTEEPQTTQEMNQTAEQTGAMNMQQETMQQPVQQPNMGMPMQQPNMGMPMQQPNMGMPMQQPNMGMPMQQQNMGMPMQQPNMQVPPQNVQPAQFQAFGNVTNLVGSPENIDLIMDVPLNVTVELGRTSKSIQEILEFAPGTIIELDKIAGEPIDVLVNGKHVAKGEVVVIEESFGIRVTEIIK